MKTLVGLFIVIFSLSAQAYELEVISCKTNERDYRMTYFSGSAGQYHDKKNNNVLTYTKHWDVSVVEQTRHYKVDEDGIRSMTYDFTFSDSSVVSVVYKLVDSSYRPTGYFEFLKGSYKGPLTTDENGTMVEIEFDHCSILNLGQ